MPVVTITLSVALIVLGLFGYINTGMASWTALIPALFGLPLLLCGVLAIRHSLRKHAMHAAVIIAAVGLFGAASMSVGKLPLLFSDPGQLERPMAVTSQLVMAVLCLVYIVLAVFSFISARRGTSPQPGEENI